MVNSEEELFVLKRDGLEQFLRNKLSVHKNFFALKNEIKKQWSLSTLDKERMPDKKIIALERLLKKEEENMENATNKILEALEITYKQKTAQ